MIKYQYTLFYLNNIEPQWDSDTLRPTPKGQIWTNAGCYKGYIALKEQINKLKLASTDNLWYRVLPQMYLE